MQNLYKIDSTVAEVLTHQLGVPSKRQTINVHNLQKNEGSINLTKNQFVSKKVDIEAATTKVLCKGYIKQVQLR